MDAQNNRQAGYSLAEMLTVVAIIGTLALVSVPAFMNYYNSNKVKTSMRTFTSDLRGARMTAISRGRIVKFSYRTAAASDLGNKQPALTERTYNLFEGNRSLGAIDQITWTPITGTGSNPPKPEKILDDVTYFPQDSVSTKQTFLDEDRPNDGWLDVIFYPDGHVKLPPNTTVGTITIKSDRKVPKPIYAIEISPSGRVAAR
jgi:prepilin-type N-terminal cleavage/methylation domain-containing protein